MYALASVIASLSSCLPSVGAREATASPCVTSNKKSALTPHPQSLGRWLTAPSVDRLHVRFHAFASGHRLQPPACEVGDDPFVHYPTSSLWPVSIFFCSLCAEVARGNNHHRT